MQRSALPRPILDLIRRGTVIPATPLALNCRRQFDERRQRALMRYYIDAGVGGIAVGMHFTQFEIRTPGIDLFEPVLRVCADEIDRYGAQVGRPIAKVAGFNGRTESALQQAKLARDLGYHFGIASMAAFRGALEQEMVRHMRELANVMPVFGFYLLTGVGGIRLPYSFWREVVEIENLVGIKIAPFDRYGTVDVARAVADSGRESDITLYTGNDDSIVYDFISPYRFGPPEAARTVRIRGGLLGQWGCWTRRAVELHARLLRIVDGAEPVTPELLTLSAQITDANAALFDPAHDYAGSIPGVNEILRRQGLLEGIWTLKRDEVLSAGQAAEIDRVCAAYPHLTDDDFVRANLDRWVNG
ncbi:MAG: dihydrodipicolinate synthase family protein [Verrucomicrobia bacterium]|nr:dihydrodipicolinate synthase family protein [Verrucomicrobiota bacterium]